MPTASDRLTPRRPARIPRRPTPSPRRALYLPTDVLSGGEKQRVRLSPFFPLSLSQTLLRYTYLTITSTARQAHRVKRSGAVIPPVSSAKVLLLVCASH